MKKILITSVLIFILSIYHINTLAEDKIDKRIFEPKIITTNYDSLAPLLRYNGWEKLSNEEKVKFINGWKEWIKKSGVSYGPMPDGGLIKDEETALKIAEIYLYGMYGDEIYFGVPYVAVRVNDSIWHISSRYPPNWHGSIIMDINAKNGMVLAIGKSK